MPPEIVYKVIVGVLIPMILGLFAWVWKASKELALLRQDVDNAKADMKELKAETTDRYHGKEAKQEQNELRKEITLYIQREQEKLERRLERIEQGSST